MILLVLSTLILLYLWHYRKFYIYASKLPSVKGGLPIVGFAHLFLRKNNQELYNQIKEITSTPGPSPRKFWFGPMFMIIIDDPMQLQNVLNSPKCIDKPSLYEGFGMKKGLLVSNGALWKNHRKLIEPAFSPSVIKSFLPIFNKKSKLCIDLLAKHLDSSSFDILEYMSALSLDLIFSTSSDMEMNIQLGENNDILRSSHVAANILSAKIVRFWLQYEPILRMTDIYELEQKHLVNGLYKTVDKIILMQMQNKNQDDSEKLKKKKPQIFIDQLFKKRDEFTYEEIKDEFMTVIAAGFDTIAITMSFIVLILAMHQDVQEKAFQELQHVFNSNDEDVDEEKISQLTYLDLVIKETMRFWPTVPFFGRLVTEDIEVGSHVVPAKSIILVPVNKIHRNKDYWGDDADEFKPERFNSESFRNVPTYAYVPFAKGPRNCIGGNYAMKAMKIALSYFLRNYKVMTDLKVEDITFELVITARIIQGCKVKIMKRDFESENL